MHRFLRETGLAQNLKPEHFFLATLSNHSKKKKNSNNNNKIK